MKRVLLSATSALAILALSMAPAGAGVILSEIDYDQPGTDFAEWVELHNPDSTPQSLVGLELVFHNGNSCTDYNRYDLDPITIPAGGYVVIGNIACATTLITLPASNAIQNGPEDSIYIQDRNSSAILDGVEYESIGTSVCGFDPTSEADDNSDPILSIQRCFGGWVADQHTPCAANACPPVSVDAANWGEVKAQYR